ncbi:hypothetical protein CCOS865_03522 [Pseudomonas reidholzensis]|uniref:RHS repeat-associated core domain-containing protein n=1 Tax=Pseudomonas reidholzensis TaxID=1785162 RepID=A0A383RWT8_9PSED|nr:RHS repeat-associated core domain-containing protein [Pseudomonas reidholzensis]SYX91253.1 hypothetical protein CCOS865_03522 [Pseudomonas reidholzensis]
MHSLNSITLGRSVRHFYQGERLATQMLNQGDSTSVLWAQEAALAQQSAEGAQLLQVDQPGSVLGMQRLALVHGMAYTPYGHRVDDERAALLGFNGQWREPGARGYLLGNGHRLYSPRLMRFYSPDSLSPFGEGGPNAYGYCAGDPVNRLDPSGKSWSGILKFFGLKQKTGLTKAASKATVAVVTDTYTVGGDPNHMEENRDYVVISGTPAKKTLGSSEKALSRKEEKKFLAELDQAYREGLSRPGGSSEQPVKKPSEGPVASRIRRQKN